MQRCLDVDREQRAHRAAERPRAKAEQDQGDGLTGKNRGEATRHATLMHTPPHVVCPLVGTDRPAVVCASAGRRG